MKVRIVIPIFQKRKLRPKEDKWLIPGNTVRMSLIRGSQAFPQGLSQGAQHPLGSGPSCQNQRRPSTGRSNYATVIRWILKQDGYLQRAFGNVWGLFSSSCLGWREPLICRDRSQGCQMFCHVQDHPAKWRLVPTNAIASLLRNTEGHLFLLFRKILMEFQP